MENMTNHQRKKRISDRKIRLSALCWLFSLGSVIGFVLEGIWSVLRLGYWENHSATVWGPFCIVYGIGTVLMYSISALVAEKSLPVQFGIFALAGGVVEYFASWFQELVFGVSTWNYDHHFLNYFFKNFEFTGVRHSSPQNVSFFFSSSEMGRLISRLIWIKVR